MSIPVVAVVDDDNGVLESLRELLESAHYAVHTFSSARELLEAGVLVQIDCLISDVAMPDIDGLALADLAQDTRPGLPIILISGQPQSTLPFHSMKAAIHAFFPKPFDEHALLDSLADAIGVVPPRP